MPARILKISQLEATFRADQAHVEQATLLAIQDAALAGVPVLVNNTEKAKAVDTGNFKAAWRSEDLPDGARITNDAPYAIIIEEGCQPHWPPFYPIFEWAARVRHHLQSLPFAQPGLEAGYYFQHRTDILAIIKNDVRLLDAYELAQGVCRKIAAEGLWPRHIMRDAQSELLGLVGHFCQIHLSKPQGGTP